MPTEMHSNESSSVDVPATDKTDAVDCDGKLRPTDPASNALPLANQRFTPMRKLLIGVLGAVIIAAAVYAIPWIRFVLGTVSTDDAFVNGHVTFVAPRVRGQVARVLVDDNNRVHKGDLLVELDKEPFRDAVAVKKAAVDTAQADLDATRATVRGVEAQAMSRRWQLQQAIENVENQIALLHARVAALKKAKATLTLAQQEFDRTARLVVSETASRELYDQRQASLSIAQAGIVQALADVNQVRVSLGLQTLPEDSADLDRVPPDLDQTFSSVLQAQAELIQTAAELGVLHSYNQTPKLMLEEFYKLDPKGDVNRTFDRLASEAPAVKQAEAKLAAAKRNLALAELDLRYCDVAAEIDGVVTRRNVNPGNDVQAGQNLMALRSLSEIWVDANFKETQLRDLRIGQAADLYVDMYGDKQVFKGRIAGFTMGTGSTLALLPPQNATGNFVKIVQRLPVRIELEGYEPDKNPLFIGTSVVPYVYINKPPTGPDAGKFLQSNLQPSSATAPSTSAQGAGK
ncbi:HlyD family secretion protein [Bradyrhizobium sp. CB2312]|uniref:HlyD family secretion protein n=1 Tax=Bradyrhizobium sp. CB2312 TaxID=3039155 RepID=UPI0024B05DB1|nr:HlyD family secretion protein [Bradyrhizobium sp. CB2312]WFU69209.1 HlyD family secretion protein [Bradyrhizobium sp. CB2312]